MSDSPPTVPLTTSGETTVALHADPQQPARPPHARGGFGRELAGALAVGLSVLAVVVVVFQVLGWARGVPGPGTTMVLGHLGAAALAVLAQRVADRSRGWVAAAAAIGVVVITAVTMWLLWWS